MGVRILCLICAAVVLMTAFFGIRVSALGCNAPPLHLARSVSTRRPNPLASAMLLVLGGVGISMLFDKKNKDR